MQTGTLSGNACSAYGAPATIVGTTSQTVASGHCYLLTLTGTDNVGNAATISTTVKVDTTAPSAPTTFGFSALTNSYYPGAGSIVYFKGGTAGGFTATASGATDADSGIASYNYGAVAGAGWGNVSGAYTFTGLSPTGTGSATATNGVGVTGASASFTAQSDSTAPAGGALTANTVAASGVGTSSYLNSGTTLTINSRTDYTETQTATASGLASSTLTMADRDALGQHVQRLRRAGDDHGHHRADGRERPLLPAHADRHRQRRQRRLASPPPSWSTRPRRARPPASRSAD